MQHLKPEHIHSLEAQLEGVKGLLPEADDMRRFALERLKETGLPNKRDEDWRYMDLSDVAGKIHVSAGKPKNMPAFKGAAGISGRVTYLNGRHSEDLSMDAGIGQVVTLSMLAQRLASDPDGVDGFAVGHDGIHLANTVLMSGGMALTVPEGIAIDQPLELEHVTCEADDHAVHLRHAIELEPGSSLTIIEYFRGDGSSYWNNVVSQIRLSKGAKLRHIRIIDEGAQATHTSRMFVDLDAGARYDSFTLGMGGKAARSDVTVRLMGADAFASIDGLSLGHAGQTLDTFVRMQHMVPGADSDQVHRTVLAAQATSAFQGRILVERDAQQTNADQSCKAILLDRSAEANAKPELEIYADDVKCSHGATVGELDDTALFYMLARGMDPRTAKGLLIKAFASESFARIDDQDILDLIEEKVDSWLARERVDG